MAVLSNSPRSLRSVIKATHGLIEFRQLGALQRGEIVLVRIPTAHVDFNKRHSGLHQATRHQAAATERRASVLILHVGRFLHHFEGGHLLAGHQADGLLENLLVIAGGIAAVVVDEILLHGVEHREAIRHALQLIFILSALLVQIAHFSVAVHNEWRVSHAQKARTDAAASNRNERRNLEVRHFIGKLMGDNRAVAGMFDRWVWHIAGVHVVTATVVVRFLRAHRAYHGQAIHLLGQARHVLANLQAIEAGGNRLELATGRCAGLEVEHVDRRWPAAHP